MSRLVSASSSKFGGKKKEARSWWALWSWQHSSFNKVKHMLLWVQHLCMLNDVFNVTFPTVNHPWVNPQGKVVLGIKQERNKIHDHVVLSQGIWYVLTREIHTWRGRELICSRAVYLLPERNTFSYLMCIFLISVCVCVCDLMWLRVHLFLLLSKNVVSNFGLIHNSGFFSMKKWRRGSMVFKNQIWCFHCTRHCLR